MPDRLLPAASPHARDDFSLRDLWAALVRHRWLVAGVTAAMLALVVAYTSVQPRVYSAEARIRIDEEGGMASLLSDIAPGGGGGGSKLETEMLVLQSRRIAEAVVDSLDLTLQVQSPALPRGRVFASAWVPVSTPPASYLLRRRQPGVFSLEVLEGKPGSPVPATVRAGEPFRIGPAVLRLAPGMRGQEEIRFGIGSFRDMAGALASSLEVYRVEFKADVVAVRYATTDPELAAAVPNAVVDNFISLKNHASKTETRSTVEFLQGQVTQYAAELRNAEDALRGFREQVRVVNPEEEGVEQVRRLAALQAERDGLRSQREALAALLQRVDGGRGTAGSTPYRQLASFPVFLNNRAVQDLLMAITAIETQRSAAVVGRTEQHQEVASLDERRRELEGQLLQIARNYLGGLDEQIISAEAALGRFGAQMEDIPAREVAFARLAREQELMTELYTLLQKRLKEAEILQAAEPADIQVIDAALVPQHPISPRPVRNVAIGLVLGLMMGVSLALARQLLDTKVRTREDAMASAAGIPIIATIPSMVAAHGHGMSRFRPTGQPVRMDVMSRMDPASPASEAFRALRTNITFSGAGQAPRVLVVTSAMPGEGKSTISSNLAVSLAQQGNRVVLVDADLRRGLVHRLLDVPQNPGLSHLLVGRATLDEAVHPVPAGADGRQIPLHLLPTGVYPPNPAELLGTAQMAQVVAELRTRFDVVVIDAPPLNVVTDAAILAKMADSTLLVTRANVSDKRAVQHATAQLMQVRAPLAGVILNGVEASSSYYGTGYSSAPGVPESNGNGTRESVGAHSSNGRH